MEVGDKVEVKLSKDWVMVIQINENMILCRTKNGTLIPFYLFELTELK
jgi:hypothetical protein